MGRHTRRRVLSGIFGALVTVANLPTVAGETGHSWENNSRYIDIGSNLTTDLIAVMPLLDGCIVLGQDGHLYRAEEIPQRGSPVRFHSIATDFATRERQNIQRAPFQGDVWGVDSDGALVRVDISAEQPSTTEELSDGYMMGLSVPTSYPQAPVFVTTSRGILQFSLDAGATWYQSMPPAEGLLSDIDFACQYTGHAVHEDGTVFEIHRQPDSTQLDWVELGDRTDESPIVEIHSHGRLDGVCPCQLTPSAANEGYVARTANSDVVVRHRNDHSTLSITASLTGMHSHQSNTTSEVTVTGQDGYLSYHRITHHVGEDNREETTFTDLPDRSFRATTGVGGFLVGEAGTFIQLTEPPYPRRAY